MTKEIVQTNSTAYALENLQEIRRLADDFKLHAISSHTLNAYLSDWQDFEIWCKQKNLQALPAEPYIVSIYLADRASNKWEGISGRYNVVKIKEPLKVSTLLRRLNTISRIHQRYELAFNRRHPEIEDVLRGIKRKKGSAQCRKTPTLIEDIKGMVDSLPETLIGIRDRAILLLGFTGAFRRSELVSLNINDLVFKREGIEVSLLKSKTDQEGEGRIVPIPYGSNPLTCPVRALQDWLKIAQISNGPLFRAINRHGHIRENALTPLSVAIIVKRNSYIQDKIKHSKHDCDYSAHSLRAGFVTTAAIKGVPEHLIMNQTGHKRSDTVKKYIRLANTWTDCAATKIGL